MCRTLDTTHRRLASAALPLMLGLEMAHAGTLTVPADYPTIQDAVDAAVDGDEVIVADGIYNTDVNINNKSITLRSDSEDPALCTIDGTGIAVSLVGAGTDSIVRGFKIRDALRGVEINADASASIQNCIIEECTNSGGLFMNGVSLAISDSIVRNNATINAGGGILIAAGSVTITQSLFRDNAVTGANAYGGGLHVGGNATLVIADSVFRRNTAIGNVLGRGGGLYASGGVLGDPLMIVNTKFDDNESNDKGGGLYIEYRSAVLGNVEVTDNTSIAGGGMFIENATGAPNTVLVANALVTNNEATGGSGGGIRQAQDSFLTVTNSTIYGNTSSAGGGGVANGPNSNATLVSCIVGGSSPNDIAGAGTTIVTYSDVEDGFVGTGNISAPPLFADAAGGNYRLTSGSPCIDAGNTVAYSGPALDLDGQVRAVDDTATANTGFALATGAIDMGAYEYQPIDTCPTDLDDDGQVAVTDLITLLNAWGACP